MKWNAVCNTLCHTWKITSCYRRHRKSRHRDPVNSGSLGSPALIHVDSKLVSSAHLFLFLALSECLLDELIQVLMSMVSFCCIWHDNVKDTKWNDMSLIVNKLNSVIGNIHRPQQKQRAQLDMMASSQLPQGHCCHFQGSSSVLISIRWGCGGWLSG